MILLLFENLIFQAQNVEVSETHQDPNARLTQKAGSRKLSLITVHGETVGEGKQAKRGSKAEAKSKKTDQSPKKTRKGLHEE